MQKQVYREKPVELGGGGESFLKVTYYTFDALLINIYSRIPSFSLSTT